MKVQFIGTLDPDEAADEFIFAFLARRKGQPVTADQVWMSVKSRGLVPSDGRPTASKDADDGAAIAEISQRLQKWFEDGLVGGDPEPEPISGVRHFWALGNPMPKS